MTIFILTGIMSIAAIVISVNTLRALYKRKKRKPYAEIPYDISINKEGLHEIHLRNGKQRIRLPQLVAVENIQDPELAHAGVSKAIIMVYVSTIK